MARLTMLSSLFPLLYGAIFVALLWQAFRVMGKGFRAASGPPRTQGQNRPRHRASRTADNDGKITDEAL